MKDLVGFGGTAILKVAVRVPFAAVIPPRRRYDVRKFKVAHWMIAAALATAMAVLGWFVLPVVEVAWCLHDLDTCTTGHPGIPDVQNIAALRLPKDARLRYSLYSAWLEWELDVIVEFPSAETDRFLTDNAVPPLSATDRAVPDGWSLTAADDPRPEWHPERVDSYAGVHACTATRCRDLMLDKDEAGVTVLYIYMLSDDQPRPTPS
ncbi:hypothetical protein [Dactylosporangium sp. NPDC049140]|uniref:hypothetical protein n=1 Tax=Dactylosporangium sp. NPDC049140 TaxID=3155647 RepID=UPI0033C4C8DB